MKPIYDPFIKRWLVNGLGHYDTRAEAKEAIRQNSLSDTLVIRINPNTKQLLQALADSKKISTPCLVRQIIEKEVTR